MLTVTVETHGDTTTLHCLGRIVRGHETAILCAAIQQEGRNVILDLALVDVVDDAGIGALVSLQAAGVYLTLMNPTEQVKEIFEVAKLDSVFEIHESRSIAGTKESTQAGLPDNEFQRLYLPHV
jgi:anti-anti-sigma factor